MRKHNFLMIALLISITSFAQVGIGTQAPSAKSILDLTATDKGLLLPRMTTAQRTAIAPTATTDKSMQVFDTTTNSIWFWNGTTWIENNGKNLYNADGTIPSSTNRTVTLSDRTTSKLTIAPTGEAANISTLNVIGGNAAGGVTSGITVSSNFSDSTNKTGVIKVPQFLNSSPPVQMIGSLLTATDNFLHIGGAGSGSQASPSQIEFRVDGDSNLSNSSATSSVQAMTIKGVTGAVGIGTISPDDSAILDISSTNKGILFPRVNLLNETHDLNGSGSNAKSLMVFNIGSSLPEGYYWWSGTKWRRVDNSVAKTPTISTLTCIDAVLEPGYYTSGVPYVGTLSIPYSGGNGASYDDTSSNTQGVIGPINGLYLSLVPGTLSSNGKVYYEVYGTPTVSSPTTSTFNVTFLGNSCNVIVGKGNTDSKVAFFQANSDLVFASLGGTNVGVNFAIADESTNNCVTLNADGSFTINYEGFYDVSGFFTFTPNGTIAGGATANDPDNQAAGTCAVNGLINYSTDNGATYQPFTGARSIWVNRAVGSGVLAFGNSINIPSAVRYFRVGNRIKMFVNRYAAGLVTGAKAGIYQLNGLQYNRAIKIQKL